jgi:hypothetical protein
MWLAPGAGAARRYGMVRGVSGQTKKHLKVETGDSRVKRQPPRVLWSAGVVYCITYGRIQCFTTDASLRSPTVS